MPNPNEEREEETRPETFCDCKDWEPGMKKINGPIFLQQTRGGFCFDKDHFITMKYCPWCGETLKEETKDPLFCECGRPKREWNTQCEVCMGACPDKVEPEISREGEGHD